MGQVLPRSIFPGTRWNNPKMGQAKEVRESRDSAYLLRMKRSGIGTNGENSESSNGGDTASYNVAWQLSSGDLWDRSVIWTNVKYSLWNCLSQVAVCEDHFMESITQHRPAIVKSLSLGNDFRPRPQLAHVTGRYLGISCHVCHDDHLFCYIIRKWIWLQHKNGRCSKR